MAAFMLSSAKTVKLSSVEAQLDMAHGRSNDAAFNSRSNDASLNRLESAESFALVGDTSDNSNESNSAAAPTICVDTDTSEVGALCTNAGAPHLTLSATITTWTHATHVPPAAGAVQGQEPVWYVHGLYMHGATWLSEEKERAQSHDRQTHGSQDTASAHGSQGNGSRAELAPAQLEGGKKQALGRLEQARGCFVQRPVSGILPIVALHGWTEERRGTSELVPIYQLRQKGSSMVAVLHFANAGQDPTWATAANIVLEPI